MRNLLTGLGWTVSGVAALLVAVGGAVAGADFVRGRPYAAERVYIDGVENAGRVNTHLYRGAQPSKAGLRALKNLGVDTVVSLTLGRDEISGEKDDVEALGMRYVHLPWSTVRDPPPERVSAFLALLTSLPNETVFVHCKAGVDRTGVMVAAYRIAVDQWRSDSALAEMNAFHFHSVFLPHLARYVAHLRPASG